MYTYLLPWLLADFPSLVSAGRSSRPPAPPRRRDTNYGYYIPMDEGGSMLTVRAVFLCR